MSRNTSFLVQATSLSYAHACLLTCGLLVYPPMRRPKGESPRKALLFRQPRKNLVEY